MQEDNSLIKIIDKMHPNIEKSDLSRIIRLKGKKEGFTQAEIANLLVFFCDHSFKKWPYKDILGSINESMEELNWREIFTKILKNNENISVAPYMQTLIKCWTCVSGVLTVPYEILFSYANKLPEKLLVKFYKIVISNETQNISLYSNIFFRRLISHEELKLKYKRTIEFETNLNCIELFEAVKGNEELILFIKALSPEYCLIGLGQIMLQKKCLPPAKCSDDCEHKFPHRRIFLNLLKYFMDGSTNHLVFNILFKRLDKQILYFMQEIDVSLTKALDVLLEHKAFNLVTDHLEPFNYCCDIIILSSRRDHLNLDIWLENLPEYSRFLYYLYEKVCVSNKDLFPFTVSIVNTVVQLIENKILSVKDCNTINDVRFGNKYESLTYIREIKTAVSEIPNVQNKAVTFLTDIIQSNSNIDEQIKRIIEYTSCEDIENKESIFAVLIENYSCLYKLPNSEIVAKLYGEMIKRKRDSKRFFKSSLSLIKKSLSSPASDREYNFAFTILEVFYNLCPDEFLEIEANENIRIGLVKKELVIVDDTSKPVISLIELLSEVTNVKLTKSLISEISTFVQSVLHKETNFNTNDLTLGNHSVDSIVAYLLFSLLDDFMLILNFLNVADECLLVEFFKHSFQTINLLLQYSLDKEEEFAKSLGRILGKQILGKNSMLKFEDFDLEDFIFRAIEYRKISVCTKFVVSFLYEGTFSIIYVPNNPWVMRMLVLCNELYSCTMYKNRENIKYLFMKLNVPLKQLFPSKIIRPLANYYLDDISQFDIGGNAASDCINKNVSLVKKVISITLDFSIRECTTLIFRNVNNIIKPLLEYTFLKEYELYKGSEEELEIYLRNFIINIVTGLVFSNSQEILKKTILDNLRHFFKISSIEVGEERIYKLIGDNLLKCMKIIQNSILTEILESMGKYIEGIKEKNYGVSSKYDTVTDKDELVSLNYFPILNTFSYIHKKALRSIENNEYQEIRSSLIQMCRNIPLKSRDFILEELPLILRNNKYVNFRKTMHHILKDSPNKDEDCFNLSKFILGEIIRNTSGTSVSANDDYLFDFLGFIFKISPKTKRTTVGWLMYSNDENRNFRLAKKFIERDFISLEEYDTNLSLKLSSEGIISRKSSTRSTGSNNVSAFSSGLFSSDKEDEHVGNKSNSSSALSQNIFFHFVTTLLTDLMFGEVVACSPYSFTRTIGKLSEMAQDPVVGNFLKRIEVSILEFGPTKSENENIFDSFINLPETFNIPSMDLHSVFKEKYDIQNFHFLSAYKSCWYHFLFYSGDYRYLKVDVLAYLLKHDGCIFIYSAIELLVQASEKKIHSYSLFFCRLFVKFLDSVLDDTTYTLFNLYRPFVIKTIELLCPEKLPTFGCQWLEIVSHPFFYNCTDQELMFITTNLLSILQYNSSYEHSIYTFISSPERSLFVKKYNTYISFLCPNYCINIKNLLNKDSRVSTFNSYNSYFSRNGVYHNFMDAIDFTNTSPEGVKYYLKKYPTQIIYSIVIRYHGKEPPEGIIKAYKEALKVDESLVSEIEGSYYNYSDIINKEF